VCIVYALALMAKPMAVTFPVVLLILDFFVYPKYFQTTVAPDSSEKTDYYRAILEKLPLLGLSAASCAVTIIAQDSGHAIAYLEKHSLAARWRTATSAYLIYLKQFLLPVDLAAFYPLNESKSLTSLIVPGLALLVLVIVSTLFVPAFPLIAAGLYFYLITLVPVIGLVQVGGQAHADRYMYLPSIGILMMCIYLVPSKGKKRFALGNVLSLCFILYLMLVSYWQISYWQNRHSLFSRVLDATGPNYRAYTHLGGYYLSRGMLEDARQQSAAAVALEPESPVAYRLIGHIALAEEKLQTAERFYRLALAKGDYSAELQNNLGIVLAEQGRIADGITALEKALKIEPTMPKAQLNLQLYRRRAIQEDSR
jgi:tetratricopeptide (TPR) repeat protein